MHEENHTHIYIERRVRTPSFAMSYEHMHNFCEIFYLRTGSCVYNLNNKLYHLSAGEMFVVKPGDPHSTCYEGSSDCERTVIYCDLNALPPFLFKSYPDLKEKFSQSGKIVMVKNGRTRVERLLTAMLQENRFPDEYTFDFLHLQTLQLFLTIHREGIFVYNQASDACDKASTSDIDNATKYIADNYAMDISLEDVAKEICLSPTYLSKKFKKVTGLTFKEYINYIRLKNACQMLITTDDSITEIAACCGFNSSNYFKDCFRKVTGVSPKAYRNQMHGELESIYFNKKTSS